MNNLKKALATASLVVVSAVGMYGCGGETPTPTAIPATATIPEATATTAMEAPTATTATSEATVTAGNSGGTGGTGGTGNSSDAMGILQNTTKAMKDLKSYHLTLTTEAGGQSITAQGDVITPDKVRLTMDMGAAGQTEVIIVDGVSYTKIAGTDTYISTPAPSDLSSSTNPAGFAEFAQDAKVVGDEQIEGADTTHITFQFDPQKVTDSAAQQSGQQVPTPSVEMGLATADIWVDKSSGYMRQFKYSADAGGTTTNVTMVFSKFNEDVTPPIEKPTNIQEMPTVPGMETPVAP